MSQYQNSFRLQLVVLLPSFHLFIFFIETMKQKLKINGYTIFNLTYNKLADYGTITNRTDAIKILSRLRRKPSSYDYRFIPAAMSYFHCNY